jgi:hypothetical protein
MKQLLTLRRVFQIIFFMGLFSMAARPLNDPDFWWHLRTGQLVIQNHAVFHTDPFSFTRQGQPWINHEWLSEVFIYAVYRIAGWAGLIVAFSAATATTLWLVFMRSAGRPYVAAAITLWGALIAAPTWGVRPHTLSLLLGSVFLLLLEKSHSRPLLIWWTVPLSLLWVNLHGEYALGVGLIVLFLAGSVLDLAIKIEAWIEAKPRILHLTGVIVACLAVVPLNPAGLKMFSYPFNTLHSASMQSYIGEWFSPNFHDKSYLPLLGMILAIIVGLAASPRRIRPGRIFLLLVTLAAALVSVRHVGIFVLIAVPVLTELIQGLLELHGRTLVPVPPKSTSARTVMNFVLLLTFAVFVVIRVRQVTRQQTESENKEFPAAAIAYLKAHRLPGPLLNHYNWGGYLIWKLYPDYPVFIDGRADLYGDTFMDDFAATYYLRKNWKRNLEQWQIRAVLLPPDSPLVSALKLNPKWNQEYADGQSVILSLRP